jgi:hypothetical protein
LRRRKMLLSLSRESLRNRHQFHRKEAIRKTKKMKRQQQTFLIEKMMSKPRKIELDLEKKKILSVLLIERRAS